MSVKLKVARGAGWTYAAYAVEAIVGLALVAFVVRHVGLADYGVLALALSVASLTMIFDFGLLGLLVQECVAVRQSKGVDAASRLLSAAIVWLFAAGVGAFAFCGFLALLLPGPFRIEPQLVNSGAVSLMLAGAAVIFSLGASGLEMGHVASESFERIARVQIIVAFVRAIATVTVLSSGFGIEGLAAIHLGAAALKLVLLWAGMSANTGGLRPSLSNADWKALARMRSSRRWATGDNLARQAAASANAIVLGILGSTTGVALFSVASRIPGHLASLASRGISVTLPFLSAQAHRDEREELRDLFAFTMAAAFAVLLPVALAGIVFAPQVIAILAGDQYAAAVPVLRALLAVTVVQAFSVPAYQVLYASGRIGSAARIGIAESLANIALTVALVPRLGAFGAAIATLVTHVAGTFGWFLPAAMREAGLSAVELLRSFAAFPRQIVPSARRRAA